MATVERALRLLGVFGMCEMEVAACNIIDADAEKLADGTRVVTLDASKLPDIEAQGLRELVNHGWVEEVAAPPGRRRFIPAADFWKRVEGK